MACQVKIIISQKGTQSEENQSTKSVGKHRCLVTRGTRFTSDWLKEYHEFCRTITERRLTNSR